MLPELWDGLGTATRTALVETVANTEPDAVDDPRLLRGAAVPVLREATLALAVRLPDDRLSEALRGGAQPALWPVALERYRRSGSYRGSEERFRALVGPFAGTMGADRIEALLDAIAENGQNSDAAGTPRLLGDLLAVTPERSRPNSEARDRFVRALDKQGVNHRQRSELSSVLTWDDWTPPARSKPTSPEIDDPL